MKYTIEDLPSLVSHLKVAAAKWRRIGLHLRLQTGQLDIIEKNNPRDVERCLEEIITVWLKTSGKTTEKQLSLALKEVGEKNLAQELHQVKNQKRDKIIHPRYQNSSSYGQIFLDIFAVLCLSFGALCLSYGLFYKFKPGKSSSLPVITEELIGRSSDLNKIMKHLSRSDIQVFNLYGIPGIGKSMIANDIGHAMLKQGMDVHYIKVEFLQGSEALRQKLMNITDNNAETSVQEWAKNLETPSLLILDNVDGSHWIQNKMKHDLCRNFINVLQSYSRKLKILMTSQVEILILNKYYSYRLKPLNTQDCVTFLKTKTAETYISTFSAEKICNLVGSVPLIIKILSPLLRPQRGYQVDHLIERLKSPSNIQFIALQGNRTNETRVISALGLSFQSLTSACSLFSLLLARQKRFNQGSIVVIAKEIMQKLTGSKFYIEDCIYELTTASLLEEQLSCGVISYEFHIIVRSYLQNIKINNKTLLNAFWEQYLKKNAHEPYVNKDLRFNSEDFEVFANLMQTSEYSTIAAIQVLHNESFVCEKCSYKKLQAEALKILKIQNYSTSMYFDNLCQYDAHCIGDSTVILSSISGCIAFNLMSTIKKYFESNYTLMTSSSSMYINTYSVVNEENSLAIQSIT